MESLKNGKFSGGVQQKKYSPIWERCCLLPHHREPKIWVNGVVHNKNTLAVIDPASALDLWMLRKTSRKLPNFFWKFWKFFANHFWSTSSARHTSPGVWKFPQNVTPKSYKLLKKSYPRKSWWRWLTDWGPVFHWWWLAKKIDSREDKIPRIPHKGVGTSPTRPWNTPSKNPLFHRTRNEFPKIERLSEVMRSVNKFQRHPYFWLRHLEFRCDASYYPPEIIKLVPKKDFYWITHKNFSGTSLHSLVIFFFYSTIKSWY